MSQSPSLTGKQLVTAKHPDGRRTVVPVHSGETISRGLLARILRDCEVDEADLV